RLAGALPEALPRFVAEADFTYRKKAGRREYVRVSLHATGGLPRAKKFAREGAGLLTSLTQSDAFAELHEEITMISPGDRVAVLPFGAVF
ncbi:MAG: molybdopterin molybdenumtransferase MoeA, partial [Roseomonas sp.]|nr:molybdopterin molybdenumtransferase MoeA [Roseomonas sp.]